MLKMSDANKPGEHAHDGDGQHNQQERPSESEQILEGSVRASSNESRTPGGSMSIRGDWRELAQRIEIEKDPDKMIGLVQELIVKFDEERLQRPSRPLRRHNST
jgi:hypothetical protein